MDTGTVFSLRLRVREQAIELSYPLATAVITALVVLACLAVDELLLSAFPIVPGLRRSLLDVCLVGLALAVMWQVWWTRTEIDRAADRVSLAGWITIGRASEIVAIASSRDQHGALWLLFREPGGRVKRWSVPGVSLGQAPVMGLVLAASLEVPFSYVT